VGVTIEDETHSGSRNVVGKFILHTLQNPQHQKLVLQQLGDARFEVLTAVLLRNEVFEGA
jgi:hypothetical protein